MIIRPDPVSKSDYTLTLQPGDRVALVDAAKPSGPHIICNYEDSVTVFWDTGICTTVNEDGSVEQHYQVPPRQEWALLDEEEAIVYFLEELQKANLGKAAWKKITEYFGGTV